MKKKIVASLLALSMMISVSAPAFAVEQMDAPKLNSNYHVMWTNTDRVNSTININSNGRAGCVGIIEAREGTTKIQATFLLKQVKSNGTGTKTVKSWTKTVSGDYLLFDGAYYVSKGYEYEFEVYANVYRDGIVENVSVSDYEYFG
ncbi:hypothetical protein [Clostridium merdae]|uniref:hypothetical protein n=1 Tax=Clostridium merdae TaxID=1958780 RepID=UPI000A26E1C7|nr:hypothetical protein [Clostridium merdae]